MGQLTRDVRDALAANARTKIVFATSPDDASVLSKHFAPQLTDYDLANLAAFQGACRPCVGGAHGPAFTFKTQALGAEIEGRADSVKAATALNFAVKRSEIDTQLRKRVGELGEQSVRQSVAQSVKQ